MMNADKNNMLMISFSVEANGEIHLRGRMEEGGVIGEIKETAPEGSDLFGLPYAEFRARREGVVYVNKQSLEGNFAPV